MNATTLIEKNILALQRPDRKLYQNYISRGHQILLGNNKPGFENLTNLDKLPLSGIYVVALPMKIAKGSGAPLHIIATLTNP